MIFPSAVRIVNGFIEVLAGGYEIKTAFGIFSGSASVLFVPAVSGKRIRILGYRFQAIGSNGAMGTFLLGDTSGGGVAIGQSWDLNPREGCIVNSGPVGYDCQTDVGQSLTVRLGNPAMACYASVIYIEV
jgi:hypothetical protein